MASNFIPMVYAVLKDKGVNTKGMTTTQAVEKYNELVGKSGRYDTKSGERERRKTTDTKAYRPIIDGVYISSLADLQETPQRSRVIEIADIINLDYNEVPFEIDLSEENLQLPITGMADANGIVFMAAAFATKETLTRTIAHEYYHYQKRKKRFPQSKEDLFNEEQEAFAFENRIWATYKEKLK